MNLIKLFLFSTVFLFLGCRKPLADPQLSDFIYINIKQNLASAEASLSEKKQKLNEVETNLAAADIQSSELKLLRVKVDRAREAVRLQEQKVRYWKVKLLSREEVVRSTYLEFFNRGEEWNNVEETERYKKAMERSMRRLPASKTTVSKDSSDKTESPSPSHGGSTEEE